jgi:RHS repeat-associated protein
VYKAGGLDSIRQGDWQGSARLQTSASGAAQAGAAYAPFGESYAEWGSPGLGYTGQYGDTVWTGSTMLYDFPMRRYAPYTSRWLSPDPAGAAAVAPNNPQTWNEYAYVAGTPLEATDPSGLCGVVFGGITESPSSAGGQALMAYARSIGADVAFGLPDTGYAGGFADVASILFGSAGASVGVAALKDAASQGGPLDVIAFSGGAQTFLNSLSADPALAGGIDTVTYYSPGTSTPALFSPRMNAAAIVFGTGLADDLATLGSDLSTLPEAQTNCGHDLPCEVGAFPPLGTGGGCKNSKVFTPGGVAPLGGGSGAGGTESVGGGDPGAFLLYYVDWLMDQQVGFATHTITYGKCEAGMHCH